MMKQRTITLNGAEVTLGKKYTDTVLDIEGIAMAGASYLTGCDQVQLAAKDANGMPFEHWVDVTRLEAVKVEPPVRRARGTAEAVGRGAQRTGGGSRGTANIHNPRRAEQ